MIADNFEIPELAAPFIFQQRPIDLPGDLRPVWRVGLIVLLLKTCCRQSRARFRQLHVLNWGVRNQENRKALEEAVNGQAPLDTVLVRIEPSLNRAVDLALGEGLLHRNAGDQIELTKKGHELAVAIEKDPNLYRPERVFMGRLRKRVTETLVDGFFG
ncbi:hypothetical protein [Gemmata sp. SH-PL17]|uniref:hypothetical protein n=1 Tax=Gemmata sp. SH-PL17 TaxID=1630693 RepID=UPI0012F79C8A|nr:hypothetical protein [Gemmata sp. SH-PL17]